MESPNYYVLSSGDRNEWLDITSGADSLDITYHPGYVKALEDLGRSNLSFGGKGHLFVLEVAGGRAIYPFMAKPLVDLHPEWRGTDISSPYGYSGPVWASHRGADGQAFRGAFDDYCSSASIVTEFYRPNPFLRGCDSMNGGILIDHGPIVYIDLLQDKGSILHGYNRNCRRSICRAKGAGVTVRWSGKDRADVRDFKEVYDRTMRRNGALPDYYFPLTFYRSLASMEEATLLIAERGGETLSAAWFLTYGGSVQCFLSGSTEEGRRLNASSYLVAEAIEQFRTLGMRIMCLGGGYRNNNRLVRFKLSFSSTTAPFCSFRKIHNPDLFRDYCTASKVAESQEHYFPPYREIGRYPKA